MKHTRGGPHIHGCMCGRGPRACLTNNNDAHCGIQGVKTNWKMGRLGGVPRNHSFGAWVPPELRGQEAWFQETDHKQTCFSHVSCLSSKPNQNRKSPPVLHPFKQATEDFPPITWFPSPCLSHKAPPLVGFFHHSKFFWQDWQLVLYVHMEVLICNLVGQPQPKHLPYFDIFKIGNTLSRHKPSTLPSRPN